jgi:putative transposase
MALSQLKGTFGALKLIWVDGGYSGKLQEWLCALLPWRSIKIEVVKRSQLHTFKILPKRWIVERSFAWLGFYRRLAKDYEAKTDLSEATILLASSRQMLKRLSS